MNHAFGMLSLYVRNIEKSQAFYTDLVGLKVVPELSGPSFVFLQPTEGTPIALQDISALAPGVASQPGGFELNFEVEDVEAALKFWREKGAEVLTEITDMGAGLWFRAKDADGYVLAVYQLYPQVNAIRS